MKMVTEMLHNRLGRSMSSPTLSDAITPNAINAAEGVDADPIAVGMATAAPLSRVEGQLLRAWEMFDERLMKMHVLSDDTPLPATTPMPPSVVVRDHIVASLILRVDATLNIKSPTKHSTTCSNHYTGVQISTFTPTTTTISPTTTILVIQLDTILVNAHSSNPT